MLHLTSSAGDLTVAVGLLRAGELVALPTETVYGLAADATNPDAVRAIFRAKGRPADHPLIVHLAAAEQLPVWADEVPETAWRLASAFWPGPLTLVLPAARSVLPLVTGGQTTVALRVPAHRCFSPCCDNSVEVWPRHPRTLLVGSARPLQRMCSVTWLAGSRQWSMADFALSVLNPPSWISAATIPAFCGQA